MVARTTRAGKMTPSQFRSTAAWQKARARCLRYATHCALCRGALRFDVGPRHPKAPSVDHVVPLAAIDLSTAAGREQATSQANLRPAHVGCNSSRGAGRRRRRPMRSEPSPVRSERW